MENEPGNTNVTTHRGPRSDNRVGIVPDLVQPHREAEAVHDGVVHEHDQRALAAVLHRQPHAPQPVHALGLGQLTLGQLAFCIHNAA